jgi:hypothetical protein
MVTIYQQRSVIGEVLLLIQTNLDLARQRITVLLADFFKDWSPAKESVSLFVVFQISLDLVSL